MAKNSEMNRIEVMLENHGISYKIPLNVNRRSLEKA
jgi:hypothetical protein